MRLDAPTLFFSVSLYALLGATVVALLRRRLTADIPGLRRTALALAALAVSNLPMAISLMSSRDHARLNAGLTVLTWLATASLIEGILEFLGVRGNRQRYWIAALSVALGFVALAVAGPAPRWRVALYSGAVALLAGFAAWKLLRTIGGSSNLGRSILFWVLALLLPFGCVRAAVAMLVPGFDAKSPSAFNIVGLLLFALFLVGVVFSCILMVSDLLVVRERATNAALVAERERLAATVQLVEEARVAALAASREKTRFLAMTSHEIRTPLYGVLGLADLLEDTQLDATQADYLRRMKLTGEHLLALITSVLDLARIEEGRVDVGSSAFEPKVLAGQVHDSLRALAESKGLALSWEVAAGVPDWVLGDRVKIGQVLTNLVGNAIKFTLRGSVRTKIEASGRHGEEIRFRIVDTGPGLSSEEKQRLFLAFGRRPTEESIPAPPGIGLGLAISRALVEAMGGEIGVEEGEGPGATFWFTLPLPRAGTPREPFVPPKGAPASHLLAGERALVVEDDETSALILRHWLTGLALAVTVCGDGAEALELARTGAFRLLVLDRQLPSLDGIELGRRIRAHESAFGAQPSVLVLCTAHALREVAEEAFAAGFDEVITKPFDRAVFETLVEDLQTEVLGTG
jgi:signal transduction histidine kinase/ActR/RegA family two-component response regulator